jgi:hypothetical protein
MDGALAVGAGSKIAGNFICQLGILTIGTGCSIDGRAFTMGGAITVATSIFTLTNSMVLTASQSIASGSIPADLVLTGNISPVIKWQSSVNSTFTNPIDILRYSTLLSGSCIGPVFSTTFYRAVTLIDGLKAYSNHVTISIAGAGSAGPDMGAASQFVLFTSAGAVTEGGTTTTSLGKIGTAFGLLNAFPNSLSSILHQEDALTFACRDYLPILFNAIKAYPTTNATHAAAFGAGETLPPGVYSIAGAASIGGLLTLDGQNNANALFIFKIEGALALAAGTEIILTNGASASNIFYAVDGALGVGANSIFKGTSITLAGAVGIGANSVVDGRMFTIAGAIALANCTFSFVPPNAPIIAVSNQVITFGTQPSNITITGNTAPVVRWEKSSDSLFTTLITIANTTTTLTGAQIGVLSATTYIRAVVLLSGATLYSTIVTLVVVSGSEITVAGVISANQMIAPNAIPANLTLTGNTGQVIKWQRSLTSDFASLTDINVNNTTLTGATIGSLNVTTYFRAVVQNCTNAVLYTNTVTITVGITTTWNGTSWSNGPPSITKAVVFAANFTITGNIDALSMTVNNGAAVSINSGLTMTVTNELNTTSGSLTFENNTNLMQSNASANNSGVITIKRNTAMQRLAYTYWSSPVSGQNLLAFSPFTISSRFYTYSEPTNTFVAVALPSTNNFIAGAGYAIRAPNTFADAPAAATVFTGSFTGVPNNGLVTFVGTKTSADLGNNLVGNPYPCTISTSNFFAQNPNVGTLYFWTKSVLGAAVGSNYAYETIATGVAAAAGGLSPNGTIQVGQGFICNMLGAATITFNNVMKVGNNANQFFRNANMIERHFIKLNLTSATVNYNQIAVGYMTGATAGVDNQIDGPTFGNGANTPIMISSLINGENYAIQGRGLPFTVTDEVALGFKTDTAGNYTLSTASFDGMFAATQDFFLKDNLTGVTHNIKQTPYNFASAVGSFNGRFQLVFQNTLSISNPAPASLFVVYVKNEMINIKSSNEMTAVKIFDLRGRLVYEKSITKTNEIELNDLKAEHQVLLVQITADGKTATKKIIY